MSGKLYSPLPYFILTALLGLVPVLNNKYPTQFFPTFSPWWVEVVSVFGGVYAAVMGMARLWAILRKQEKSRALIREAGENRRAAEKQEQNDIITAGRTITRLIRNADEDLREIKSDFTLDSLKRLQSYLPVLMAEIDNEEDARIRLGVVGIYLGESFCKNFGWEWFFKADPSLKQFSYLVSVIRKQGKEADPFAWAADWMTGKRKIGDILKETDAPQRKDAKAPRTT